MNTIKMQLEDGLDKVERSFLMNMIIEQTKGYPNRMSSPCSPKVLCLKNREGENLSVTLRVYRPGDEKGMIACIRDEYGDTYFKTDFYHPAYLRAEAESGHITFLVAETEKDDIAGMLILKEFAPQESMCEIASQIFRKKYRGYGLAMPFFEYGMEILLGRDYSAAYCLPVVFHDTTQRLLYRLGLRATGFILNVFDMEHIIHSYQNGRNTKHSQGIQIRAARKRDAGIVYIPADHREFCSRIYESLGVTCQLEEGDSGAELSLLSVLSCRQDELQSSLEIRIQRVGFDLSERMKILQRKFPLKGKQTVNVFLNISDRNAVQAYYILTEMGYFLTGLKPLCCDEEYMVLHNPGEVEIYFEDYVLSKEFAEVAGYIEKVYTIQKRRS